MADNKEDSKKPEKAKEKAPKPAKENAVEELKETESEVKPETPLQDESTNKSEKEEVPAEEVMEESKPEEAQVEAVLESVKTPQDFNVGDTIIVNYKIIEGEKHRIQPFEGIVIAKRGDKVSKSFTVRRMAAGNIGVERIFQVYSPNIESIKVKSRGKVRRAKLYYLRKRVGKAATKVKEKV